MLSLLVGSTLALYAPNATAPNTTLSGRRLQLWPLGRLKPTKVAGPASGSAVSMEEEIGYQQRAMRCRSSAGSRAGALTRCVRSLTDEADVHRVYYRPKHACAHLKHCNGRGECFLGKCFCGASFSGDRCEVAKERHAECSLRSDACFRHQKHGRARVSLERWQRASWAEESWWESNRGASDDHSAEMLGMFQRYRSVPAHLGHVLELGCGPFTQLKGLLGTRTKPWSVDSVTLADPLLVYESKATHSPFRDGKFRVDGKEYPTTLHQVGAEKVGALYHDHFDTVIMMNVLEHVASGYEVLESMYNATKPGGVVILWEPAYSKAWSGWHETGQELVLDMSLPLKLEVNNPDWSSVRTRDTIRSRAFDLMAHPIRIDPSVFEFFASKFDHLQFSMGAGRRGDSSCLLIGRKKEPSPLPWY